MASINLIDLCAAYGYELHTEHKYLFEFSKESPSNNVIKNMHYHAYKALRNRFRAEVLKQVPDLPNKPLGLSFLVVERYCCGGGLDWDNAYGGLKPILDCLVSKSVRNPDGLGLIEDDCPAHMPIPPLFVQRPAKRGEGRTMIRVFEIEVKKEV